MVLYSKQFFFSFHLLPLLDRQRWRQRMPASMPHMNSSGIKRLKNSQCTSARSTNSHTHTSTTHTNNSMHTRNNSIAVKSSAKEFHFYFKMQINCATRCHSFQANNIVLHCICAHDLPDDNKFFICRWCAWVTDE